MSALRALNPKVMIALNATWNLTNFRAGLIRSLSANGFEVLAVAPVDRYVPQVRALGCRYLPLPMDNQGTHPLRDLLLFLRFLRLLHKEKPAVYLGYTAKPNIYGGLAAQLLGIPVINNIAGLGSTFITENWLTRLVKFLYGLSLSRSAKVFFQNKDDHELFITHGLVKKSVADILPGSGVDLLRFEPAPLPQNSPIRFLLIARMLWDKGVGEFIGAARLLGQTGLKAEFCLLGPVDVQNPAAIPRDQVERWEAEGIVRYLGVSDDVRVEIGQADCIVLPSYREGTPRALLEAAAMARPIITTDTIGCRDVVDDGVNGYLCKPRDVEDLASKLEKMASLAHAERSQMGAQGRKKVEREYAEQIVIDKYLAAIRSVLRLG